MMINSIIIEDDEMSRLSLEHLCSKLESVNIIGSFESPIEALKSLESNDVDLLFLDMHTPDISGLELLQSKKDLPPTIIISSDEKLAINAFEFNVIDYILKPVNLARLIKSIEKFNNLNLGGSKDKKDHIYVNIENRLIKIDLNELFIVEAKGDYILLKTTQKDIIVHSTLKNIEEKLPKSNFIKIHRSFIINTDKIIDIEDNSVLIRKEVIPISRSNRKDLLDKLNLI